MGHVVKSHLVQIGNSRGVRIPKAVLEQIDLQDEIEMTVESDRLIIRSPRRAREGWAARFETMHALGDDRMMDAAPATAWDESEWEW